MGENMIVRDAEAISTFIASKFSGRVIEELENLQLIATRSTRFDHIRLDACRRRGVAVGNMCQSMEDLLAGCDVISLPVRANEKTHNLISHDEFCKMKIGAVPINTSRGPMVDTKALLRALAEGKVAAARLDLLPEVPTYREEAESLRSLYEVRHNLGGLLADHVLVHLRNSVVTPHSAFKTREADQRILDMTAETIRAFAGGQPQNVIT